MRTKLKRALLYIGAGIVLALCFLAYLTPSFIIDLANRIVLCF
jgi:hypothetical protein